MNLLPLPLAVDPVEWTVVFHRRGVSWWFDLVAFGKFKHVSAFAYLAGLRGWVIVDWEFGGLRVAVLPHSDDACRLIRAMFGPETEWLEMRRRPGPASLTGLRIGTCVGAIKHLLNLRTWAQRPDALYRYCKKVKAHDEHPEGHADEQRAAQVRRLPAVLQASPDQG